MILKLLFIASSLISFLKGESLSSEEKYIDSLPPTEKKEFLENIAKRILDEVESTPTNRKSGEVSEETLNTHSEYVAKILKEEAANLRRRNEELETSTDDAIKETVQDSVHVKKDETNTVNVSKKTIQDSVKAKNTVLREDRSEKVPASIDLTLRKNEEIENRSSSVAGNSTVNVDKETIQHLMEDEDNETSTVNVNTGTVQDPVVAKDTVLREDRSVKVPKSIDLTLRQNEELNRSSSGDTKVEDDTKGNNLFRYKRSSKHRHLKKIVDKVSRKTRKVHKKVKKIVRKLSRSRHRKKSGKSRRVRSVNASATPTFLQLSNSTNENLNHQSSQINADGLRDLKQDKTTFSIKDDNKTINHDKLRSSKAIPTTNAGGSMQNIPLKVIYDSEIDKKVTTKTVTNSNKPSVQESSAVTEISIKNGNIILLKDSIIKNSSNKAEYTRWPKAPATKREFVDRNESKVPERVDDLTILGITHDNFTQDGTVVVGKDLDKFDLSPDKSNRSHVQEKLTSEIKDEINGKFRNEFNKIHNKTDKMKFIADALQKTLLKFDKKLIIKKKPKNNHTDTLPDKKYDDKSNDSLSSGSNDTTPTDNRRLNTKQIKNIEKTATKAQFRSQDDVNLNLKLKFNMEFQNSKKEQQQFNDEALEQIIGRRRIKNNSSDVNHGGSTTGVSSTKSVVDTRNIKDTKNLDESMLENDGGQKALQQELPAVKNNETVHDGPRDNGTETQRELSMHSTSKKNLQNPVEANHEPEETKKDKSDSETNESILNKVEITPGSNDVLSEKATTSKNAILENQGDVSKILKLEIEESTKTTLVSKEKNNNPKINIENSKELGNTELVEEATTSISNVKVNALRYLNKTMENGEDAKKIDEHVPKSKILSSDVKNEEKKLADNKTSNEPDKMVGNIKFNMSLKIKASKPLALKENAYTKVEANADNNAKQISNITTKPSSTMSVTSSTNKNDVTKMRNIDAILSHGAAVGPNNDEKMTKAAVIKSENDLEALLGAFSRTHEPSIRHKDINMKVYKVFELPPGEVPFKAMFLKEKEKKPLQTNIKHDKGKSDFWKQGPPNSYIPIYNFAAHNIPKTRQRPNKNTNENQDEDRVYGNIFLREKDVVDINKEQPFLAPVYNYAAENAYYNPENRYGPNLKDTFLREKTFENSNEEQLFLAPVYNYDAKNAYYNPNNRNGPNAKNEELDLGMNVRDGVPKFQAHFLNNDNIQEKVKNYIQNINIEDHVKTIPEPADDTENLNNDKIQEKVKKYIQNINIEDHVKTIPDPADDTENLFDKILKINELRSLHKQKGIFATRSRENYVQAADMEKNMIKTNPASLDFDSVFDKIVKILALRNLQDSRLKSQNTSHKLNNRFHNVFRQGKEKDNDKFKDLDLMLKISDEADLIPVLQAFGVLRNADIQTLIEYLKKVKQRKDRQMKEKLNRNKLIALIGQSITLNGENNERIEGDEAEDEYLEASLRELRKMISRDSKAGYSLAIGWQGYNWLATTVNIQSALSKFFLMINEIQEGKRIHPNDLEMLKYTLYVLKSSKKTKHSKLTIEKENPSIYTSRKNLKENLGRAVLDLEELEIFLKNLQNSLDDLHDALRQISVTSTYRNQDWFRKLKDSYLSKPNRKTLLEVLLHLSTNKLTDLIEHSILNGMEDNFLKYVLENPEETARARKQSVFVLSLLEELDKERRNIKN